MPGFRFCAGAPLAFPDQRLAGLPASPFRGVSGPFSFLVIGEGDSCHRGRPQPAPPGWRTTPQESRGERRKSPRAGGVAKRPVWGGICVGGRLEFSIEPWLLDEQTRCQRPKKRAPLSRGPRRNRSASRVQDFGVGVGATDIVLVEVVVVVCVSLTAGDTFG
jgi:hypothetical protein